MKHFTAALLSLAAGFAAGWFAIRPAAPAAPRIAANIVAPTGTPTDSGGLAALQAEIASLENAPAPAPAAALDLLATAAELRAKIAGLRDAGDKRALFRLMQDLAALGEPGYPGAIEIAGLLGEDGDSPLQLGGNDPRFRDVFTPGMLAMAEWILRHPSEAPAWFCGLGMRGMSHAGEIDPAPAFLDYLAHGGDAENADTAVFFLRGLELPSMAPGLAAAVRGQASHPGLQWKLLEGLGRLRTPESVRQIEALAASADPAVAGAAGLALATVRPPPERAAVTYNGDTTANDQPYGLEWGDVVVSLDSTTLTSVDHLRDLYASCPKDVPQILTVERQGKLCRMKVTHSDGSGSIELLMDNGKSAMDALMEAQEGN